MPVESLMEIFLIEFKPIYLFAGLATVVIACIMFFNFPEFKGESEQHKTIILRKRYWLFYALQFFSGARRQIFMVFAAFLM